MGIDKLGSGKRFENYLRRGNDAFSKLKKSYGGHLEDIHNRFSNEASKDTDYEEIELLKNKTRERRRLIKVIKNIILLIILSIMCYGFYLVWSSQ